MQLIDFASLEARLPELAERYRSALPFHYVVFEGYFSPAAAELIDSQYPALDTGTWDGTTYVDQKNKFQQSSFAADSMFANVFGELNSPAFLNWLERLTGIESLSGDADLYGGGLHQSTNGAFLNVHVDYNLHPKTRLYRRLNVLVYMNRDWKDEYEGHLELWALSNGQRKLLEKIAPLFNRCVIFETNEISYHGHPKPLKTPEGVKRKSLATYYYTNSLPAAEAAPARDVKFVNTEGVGGQLKRLQAGLKAAVERTRR